MTDSKYPPVVIVDENDTEIGTAMLAEAWQHGLTIGIKRQEVTLMKVKAMRLQQLLNSACITYGSLN